MATGRPWLWALLVSGLAWVPLYLQRRAAHQPDVDDYLYAAVKRNIGQRGPLEMLHAALHTGHTAPLVPLLAAPFMGGVDAAVAVELPLLLLLVLGTYLLVRCWVGPAPAGCVALVAGLNQAVLGWSLMLHFSVAASACVVWVFAAYLRSEGLRNWPWTVTAGLAFALLMLSRTMAPVYFVPLLAVIGVDVIKRRSARWGPALTSAAVVVVLAGPWWWTSGSIALRYLHSAGYKASSGFTQGADFTPAGLIHRLTWTLDDLGVIQATILVAALVIAAVAVAVHRKAPQGMTVVSAWLLLTFLFLATSRNVGTAFGLPLVASRSP
jgi:hypothetical protein